jgi:hypothetical protein
MRPRMLKLSILGAIGVTSLALGGCGTSLVGSASTTLVSPAGSSSTTTTTAPLNGEVSVAFPVVACTTPLGVASSDGWKPTILLAPIPTALVGQVEFYSDGVHTLLGPTGWSCTESVPASGAISLAVVPPGSAPAGTGTSTTGPPVGTQGIFATFGSTGHVLGVAMVCPFFLIPSWQREEAKCPKPAGEVSSQATPDVASVSDPAGVAGNLAGSGGSFPVTGVILFPQIEPAVSDGSSIDVADESCAIADAALCPTVLSDFEVREFPVPGSTAASEVPSYVTPSTRIPASRQQPVTTAPPTTLPPTPTPTVTVAPTTAPTTPPVSTPPNDQN